MANNLSTTLVRPVKKCSEKQKTPRKEIPIKTTKNNKCCMGCILPIFNSIISCPNSNVKNNNNNNNKNNRRQYSTNHQHHPRSKQKKSNQKSSSTKFIIPTISGYPVCLKDDEDFLFGYTIASMLKTFPRAERNRIKVHIFSFLAVTQNQISCNDREYFV